MIRSEGFDLLTFRVPAFELKQGQLLFVVLPPNLQENDFAGARLEMEFLELLSSHRPSSPLSVAKVFRLVKPFEKDSLIKSIFNPTTADQYLAERTPLNDEERNQLLRSLHIPATKSVSRLPASTLEKLSLIGCLPPTFNLFIESNTLYRLSPAEVEAAHILMNKILANRVTSIVFILPEQLASSKPLQVGQIIRIDKK